MPPLPNDESPEFFIARTRRMLEYADEARGFVRRAAAWRDADGADGEAQIAAVCRLWALADELDAAVCETLTAFGEALFGESFELEITRGAEAEPAEPPSPPIAVYTCAWTAARGDGVWAGAVLSASPDARRSERLEVRDSAGGAYHLPYPLGADSTALSEALGDAFFGALAGRATKPDNLL